MKHLYNFVERLEKDMSVKIFMCLDDPSDLAKLCCVSKNWYRFVIQNELCKHFCLNKYPEASKITNIVELTDKPERTAVILEIPRILVRDHKVFSFLACFLSLAVFAVYRANLKIEDYICASSSGMLPKREFDLSEDDAEFYGKKPGYWCSKGKSDSTLTEILACELVPNFCLVRDIIVQPFQGDEPELPIYSARAVRFSLGFQKSQLKPESSPRFLAAEEYDENMFVWTYTSPEFPMVQGAGLHGFRLPRPVLCMGGILKMEMLGGVQKNDLDNLYYISLSVEALGQTLPPMFDIDIVDDTGNCTLKCDWGKVYREGIQLIRMFRRESLNPHLYGTYSSICAMVGVPSLQFQSEEDDDDDDNDDDDDDDDDDGDDGDDGDDDGVHHQFID